jgi:hypothetical protein
MIHSCERTNIELWDTKRKRSIIHRPKRENNTQERPLWCLVDFICPINPGWLFVIEHHWLNTQRESHYESLQAVAFWVHQLGSPDGKKNQPSVGTKTTVIILEQNVHWSGDPVMIGLVLKQELIKCSNK